MQASVQSVLPETQALAALVRQIDHQIRTALQPSLTELDVSYDQWRVLELLHRLPGLTMAAVADLACLPNATLTRHVDRLVSMALVLRRIDQGDKRRVVVALAPHAVELVACVREVEVAIESDLRSALGF